jgi:hypothetical protein
MMEFFIELVLFWFFYSTGFVLTYVLLLGTVRPEIPNWKVKKVWKFSTLVHVVDGKRYLDWEWVTVVGIIAWIIIAFAVYYLRVS